MAKPYFTGNYGSALARVDTRPIIEAGRATGQMYANLGGQIGGMIKEYGLNKEKRAKLTGEVEAYYKENPEALSQIGMSGDEAQDKKDYTEREKFLKNDMSIAQLEGLAGKLARGGVLRSKKLQDESRGIQNQLGEQNLGLQKRLEDTTVALQESRSQEAATRNRILNMTEEDFSALRDLTQEQKRTYLEGSIAERPSRTAATIARAGGVVREEDAKQAREGLLGGPEGVAAQQLTAEEAALEGTQARTDYTKALTGRMEFMSRPVDTSIPGNVDIDKEIKAISSDVASLEGRETRVKDPNDEDKYLKLKDFLVYDDYEQKYVVNEELKGRLSPRLEVQLDALRLAYDKQTQLRMDELVPIDLKQDDGSLKQEFVSRREYLRLKKLKDEADAKAAEEARQNEIIRRSNKINRDPYMQQPEVGGMGFPFSP